MSTSIITRILKSAGLAALGLSFAVASANAQPPIFCAIKSDLMGCPGATTTLPASSAARTAADILNRNAAAQRNLDQGFNQLRNILESWRAGHDRESRVSDQRDKRFRPEPVSPAVLGPDAYYFPVTFDPAEATYGSTMNRGSNLPYNDDEVVIDGSNIPSSIDFLDPLASPTKHVLQIGLDGREIPSEIVFPPPTAVPQPHTDADGIITDRSLDIFSLPGKHLKKFGR